MAEEKDKSKAKDGDKSKDKDKEQDKSKAKDKEENEDKSSTKQPMSIRKVVIIISAIFVVIMLITVVSLVLVLKKEPSSTGAKVELQEEKKQDAASKEQSQATDSADKKKSGDPTAAGKDGAHPEQIKLPAIFYTIKPVFVVNLNSSKVKFMQINVDLMTRNPELVPKFSDNLPLIKNELVILFSNKSYDDVKTIDGREAMRREALKIVQTILQKEVGEPCVEDLMFSGFVMQ